MPSMTSDSRSEAVLESVHEKSRALSEAAGRRRFVFRKRTRMPFRARLFLFAAIFGGLLLAYLLDFFAGGQLGIQVNAWTDQVIDGTVHGICAAMADVTGTDWSGRELALSRLLLLGPTSYVLFSFFVALVIAGIAALAWSWHATKHALDDGTSNFLPND